MVGMGHKESPPPVKEVLCEVAEGSKCPFILFKTCLCYASAESASGFSTRKKARLTPAGNSDGHPGFQLTKLNSSSRVLLYRLIFCLNICLTF